MNKICILGSCVTRDIFRVMGGGFEFCYFARTSLISLMSEPLPLEESQIQLESKFQRQMVMQDFRKNFFESVEQFNPDIIIIDLIDERFDLCKFGNSYVTRSSEFVNGKLGSLYPFECVPRHQEETHILWERACDRFVERLLGVVPSCKVVLHKAFWATDYIEDGKVKKFPNQSYIFRNNDILKRYYEYLQSRIPGVRVVSETPLGDCKHVWGLSPVHYTDDYYRKIYEQLKSSA